MLIIFLHLQWKVNVKIPPHTELKLGLNFFLYRYLKICKSYDIVQNLHAHQTIKVCVLITWVKLKEKSRKEQRRTMQCTSCTIFTCL